MATKTHHKYESEKSPSLRKLANKEKNEAQHTANLSQVAEYGIPARASEHFHSQQDKKGNLSTIKVKRQVRPSVLLRSYFRSIRNK